MTALNAGHSRIKICGLRDEKTIQAMNGLPVDEIGFIFAPSRRRIDKADAPKLIQAVHSLSARGGQAPRAVGVFVNEPLEELDLLLGTASLDVVQLHGAETPEYIAELRRRHPRIQVWKVFSIRSSDSDAACTEAALAELALARLAPYRSCVEAILIDAPGGGTGEAFNWMAIDHYQAASDSIGLPMYIAGGLHADNVRTLLGTYRPYGIDVSSGVETDGIKDIEKMRLFVRRVMEA
ncbi:phosphoribosylanthranilate isomerase [Paenibacillus sp. HB172176]|uniref:phosphoribosylanthranilate isomerase n=1 Tax=Paenibacillus sp. HB172176 TaxID=2493690 RepID=UPI001438AA78|nr:phosphoribosylanthranilate isomerase [Paenibacillus sp. HB172176]